MNILFESHFNCCHFIKVYPVKLNDKMIIKIFKPFTEPRIQDLRNFKESSKEHHRNLFILINRRNIETFANEIFNIASQI